MAVNRRALLQVRRCCCSGGAGSKAHSVISTAMSGIIVVSTASLSQTLLTEVAVAERCADGQWLPGMLGTRASQKLIDQISDRWASQLP